MENYYFKSTGLTKNISVTCGKTIILVYGIYYEHFTYFLYLSIYIALKNLKV